MKEISIGFYEVDNLSTARYAAGVGADWISISFDNHNSSYISPLEAKEIVSWINGPKIIGVFDGTSLSEIKSISDHLSLDHIQMPFVAERPDLSNSIIWSTLPTNWETLNKDDLVLTRSLNRIPEDFYSNTILLLDELDFTQLDHIKNLNINSIGIKGMKEESVGFVDFEATDAFLDRLRE